MAVNTDISLSISARESGSLDMGSASARHLAEYVRSMTSGTETLKADIVWSDTRTLATTTEDLDIRGTALTGAFGQAIAIAELVGIYIRNKSTSGTLTVGGDGSAPITGLFSDPGDKIVIGPLGVFFWLRPDDGISVTAGSTDVLQIQSSASVTYDIMLIGRSA